MYHEFFGGMHVYHGGRDDVGIELSGSGCRTLESCNGNSFDWLGLFRYIMEQGDEMNISRLDVAGDDNDGVLTLDKITQQTRTRKYICKARRCVWMAGDEEEVIFGASSSSTRLRIYNKALERGVEGPWVRVEFQLRDEAADSFILNLLRLGEIGPTYGGVLLNYLRYVTRCRRIHRTTIIGFRRLVGGQGSLVLLRRSRISPLEVWSTTTSTWNRSFRDHIQQRADVAAIGLHVGPQTSGTLVNNERCPRSRRSY